MMDDEEIEMIVDYRNELITKDGLPARVVCTNRRCPKGRFRFIVLWDCGDFERSVTCDLFGKNKHGDRVILNKEKYERPELGMPDAKEIIDYGDVPPEVATCTAYSIMEEYAIARGLNQLVEECKEEK